MQTRTLITSALALAVLAMPLTVNATDQGAGKEKCSGVAKAGKNDCAAAGHACAGQAKADKGKEWVYLPKGTCERLVGGKVVASK